MIELLDTVLTMPLAQAGGGIEYGGAVGNLVSAALQTKGLVDQAAILNNFADELEWIAAAGWLVSIAIAISAVAVFGNYRQGAYLLIGPPLFFYMVTTTIQTDGVKVLFGDREAAGSIEEQRKIHSWIRTIEDGDGPATVDISFFFGVYDSIITEMVQKVVSVLIDTDNRADLRYVAREYAMAHVFQGVIENSDLNRLVVGHHLGDCGEDMALFQREVSQRKETEIEARDDIDIEAVPTKTDHRWDKKAIPLESSVKRYLTQVEGANAPFNCEGSPAGYCDDDYQLSSCKEIWEYTTAGLIAYAKELLTVDIQRGSSEGQTNKPMEEAMNDLKEWFEKGGEDPAKVVALLLYRKALVQGPQEGLQSQVFNRSPMNSAQYEAVFNRLAKAEAVGGYFRLRYFARSIPYIQGLLLYLLTIAFPFFAVFLVLPGKAPSFLAWLSLWAWVKTWDVGFALVHVTRDIFWHMMKSSVNVHNAEELWKSDPSTVMQVAFQNDPVLGQNTYWIMTSMLTMMVPLVTAHLAMGATNMFDMFKNSIDQTAVRFGSAETNAARRAIANQRERLMDEQQASDQRVFTVDAAAMAGKTTVDGTPLVVPNSRKGMLNPQNYFSKGKDGRYAPIGAATDVAERYLAAAYTYGGSLVQTGNEQVFKGQHNAEIARTRQLETAHTEINALRTAARQAADAGDDQTAAEKNKKADALQVSSQQGKLGEHEGSAEAATAEAKRLRATGSADDLKRAKKLEKTAKAYENLDRTTTLPESIPHAYRGMPVVSDDASVEASKLSEEGMKALAFERKRMAKLYRSYGDHRQANRFEREAEEIETMVKNGTSKTRGEFLREAKKISDDIQLDLVAMSRRRQTRLTAQYKAAAMAGFLKARYETTMHARSFFDDASTIRNFPLDTQGYLLNPEGRGFKRGILGGAFTNKANGIIYSVGVGSMDDADF